MEIIRKINEGKIYKHFKGNLYKVLHIAYDCESKDDNLIKVVVYEALYGDHKIWVRNYNDFISEVDRIKYPDVSQKYRFEEVAE